MDHVLRDAVGRLQNGDQAVLATVVRTSGSTPQKSGARLLVLADGATVGTLGGGCVEGDIRLAARRLLAGAGRAETRTYSLNEDLFLDDGLVCGGTMAVLLEPVDAAGNFLPFAREAVDACDGGAPVVTGTLTTAPEGSGLRVGSRILLREDGTGDGSLGDPELDRDAARRARALLARGGQEAVAAGGGAGYFLEAWTTPPTLIIAGGGHVGRALEPVARGVGFRTVVIDDRPEFSSRARFPDAGELVTQDFATALARLPINARTCIVIATRGHRHDDVALEAAARSRAGYVALLGSRRKTLLIYEALLERGIPIDRLRELRAPVGLDIGARTPAEIAIAVVAELLMFRLGGSGAPLRLADRHLERLRERVDTPPATAADQTERREPPGPGRGNPGVDRPPWTGIEAARLRGS